MFEVALGKWCDLDMCVGLVQGEGPCYANLDRAIAALRGPVRTRPHTLAAAATTHGAQSRNGADGCDELMAESLVICVIQMAYTSGVGW